MTNALALLGATALGGLISLATTYAMARRAEEASARAAARLLSTDLVEARDMLDTALQHERWWPGVVRVPGSGWTEHRAPLALRLDGEEWARLADAFESLALLERILALAPLPPGQLRELEPEERDRLEVTLGRVVEGLTVLERHGGPPATD